MSRGCPARGRSVGGRGRATLAGVRLRVEFSTEPFDFDQLPEHARVAREVVAGHGLEDVDVGPFGNTAEGPAETVLPAVAELLGRTLRAGATRVSVQVNVVDGAEAGR